MQQIGSKIYMTGDYITLGQVLKHLNLVSTGGEEKIYLSENTVIFNGTPENRRGKKLHPGDVVVIEGTAYEICMCES